MIEYYKNLKLKSSMRYAISPQIIDFKNKCELLECKFCKSKENIEIDHVILFKLLCDDFLKDRNDISSSFDDTFCFSTVFKKDDNQFQDDWIEYHRKNAILQCLCKTCNLKKKRK